ncbi:hypothetical protein LTR35_015502 [Friedmanniomyces endolithicus]|uniref:MFS general substrate transporter n=1 Tax=Friedmanniomyces endolithicus TaxID=329885 RepID=A0AAN6J1I5_9PEZI|nr:hypothetical protein LTR35_015502 [Friedmanniomyces endolithicus]KAK0276380.1 hypothetical protein LTS00_014640 [Friedmanniomyces endolithicus]KAK0308202.1 hypothetical protein LTR82_015656 [Friedmanniomyces endolithicus]KAK1017116.1 hypothetical protein LTR54_002492 [Friedmanniomyces endolithicus]
MADTEPEKTAPQEDVHSSTDFPNGAEVEIPQGWMYRSRKLGPITFPWYASPQSQLILVAFVCFLCPGMFNALGGLGGGGQVTAYVGDASNTALYSTFALVGFFAGTITNALGIRIALSFGGIGYCIYTSSYLCFDHTQNFGYSVFAGFFLGICAGVLWCAQGAIMMSYPPEHQKGRYIAVFWGIFNMGGVIGALIPLGQNIHTTSNSTVTDGTYIGFIVLTFLGACLAWTLCDAKKVVRSDGTRVILMQHPTWKSEFIGLWETLISDPWIICLWPMFFASNWFYTYQFNDVNLAQFNTRTRALNNVLYWFFQIVGAVLFSFILDFPGMRRTTRAKVVWCTLVVLTFAIWGGGYAFQTTYTRAEVNKGANTPLDPSDDYVKMDWTSHGYIGPMFLFIFYGVYDAAWQTSIYWFMGATTNNSRKLANFAGFYKGIQSAGAAIIWRLDGLDAPPPYMNIFASCWALLAGGLIIAAPVLLMKIKDTVSVEEDVKFTDESVDDVVAHKIGHEAVDQEKV